MDNIIKNFDKFNKKDSVNESGYGQQLKKTYELKNK